MEPEEAYWPEWFPSPLPSGEDIPSCGSNRAATGELKPFCLSSENQNTLTKEQTSSHQTWNTKGSQVADTLGGRSAIFQKTVQQTQNSVHSSLKLCLSLSTILLLQHDVILEASFWRWLWLSLAWGLIIWSSTSALTLSLGLLPPALLNRPELAEWFNH